MKYNHIIVDVNNLFHKNHNALSDMTFQVKGATLTTGGVYGSLRSIVSYHKRYLAENGICWYLFDNAKSKINTRKLVDPDYKSERAKQPKTFYRSLDFFRLILLNYKDNAFTVYKTNYEADDIAPVIIRQIPKNESILVISDDMDWCRLLNYKGHTVHQLMRNNIIDRSGFYKKYGFYPSVQSIVLYKVIRGDSVDSIPIGVERMPSKVLLQLMEDYSNIFDVYHDLNRIKYLTPTWKTAIRERFPRLRLNHELVSFLDLTKADIDDYLFQTKYRPAYLKLLYESLGFDLYKTDIRVYSYIQEGSSKTDTEKIDKLFI